MIVSVDGTNLWVLGTGAQAFATRATAVSIGSTFGTAHFVPSVTGPRAISSVVAGDLTRDGYPEIVIVDSTASVLTAFQNRGTAAATVPTGTLLDRFSSVTPSVLGAEPVFALLADLDQDGLVDVLASSVENGFARVRNISK